MPEPKPCLEYVALAPQGETGTPLMTIGALAKACNLTVRTLRYYEEMRLIQADSRTAGGYRLYSASALKRVNAILALQDLNFSLETIGEMLGSGTEAQGNIPKAQRISETRHRLELQQTALSEKLTRLIQMQNALAQRLNALDALCTPCERHSPQAHDACLSCEHQEIHQG